MKVGLLCSRIRVEEKLILQALRERDALFDRADPRQMMLHLDRTALKEYDIFLVRCLSHSRAFYLTRWLQAQGIPAISPHQVVATCGDKMLTTVALQEAKVPIPRTTLAFSSESALEAIEEMGYPVVLKPLTGSWGRLLARVNDRDAAEAILEHKATLGGYVHSVFYIQEYVDKPGRDIRTLVVGDEVVYAIYRRATSWITNTARGGDAELCPLTPGVVELSLAAARAVAAGAEWPGIVAVDLLETRDGQLLVNEVNHTPEFHGAAEVVEVDVAGKMVDYLIEIALTRARDA
jgi:[lysine-biosynthesis-protein LysW]--L-2-aminoadipate ligase